MTGDKTYPEYQAERGRTMGIKPSSRPVVSLGVKLAPGDSTIFYLDLTPETADALTADLIAETAEARARQPKYEIMLDRVGTWFMVSRCHASFKIPIATFTNEESAVAFMDMMNAKDNQ